MKTTRDTLAAKILAEFNLPDRCDRCLWLKIRIGSNMPYSIFAGIISTLDSYSKDVVRLWFEETRQAPPWLSGLSAKRWIPAPSWRSFQADFGELRIRGEADVIFQREDGSIAISDYKVSAYNTEGSRYHGLYEAQLNIYRDIYLALNPGDLVAGLNLIYFSPSTDDLKEYGAIAATTDHGFRLGFKTNIVPVAVREGLTASLAIEAAKLKAQPIPPASATKCRDCEKVEGFLQVFREAHAAQKGVSVT